MTASSWVSNLGSYYVQSPLEPEWSENTTLTSGSSANTLQGFLTPSPPQATPFDARGPGTTLVSGLVRQPQKGPLAGVSFSSLSPPLLSRLIPVVLRDWARVASLPEASSDPPCAPAPRVSAPGGPCAPISQLPSLTLPPHWAWKGRTAKVPHYRSSQPNAWLRL